MKKQMLTFIAGILLGTIISTGVFIALKTTDSKNQINYNNKPRMREGERRKNKNTKTEEKEETNKEKESNESA